MAKVVQLKVEGDCDCLLKVGSVAILCLTDDWVSKTVGETAFILGTVANISELFKSTRRNKCCVGEKLCEYTVNIDADQFSDESVTPAVSDVTGITVGNCVTLAIILRLADMGVNSNTLANDLYFKILKAGVDPDIQNIFKLNDDDLFQIAADLKLDIKPFVPAYFAAEGGDMDWEVASYSDNYYYKMGADLIFINGTFTQGETSGGTPGSKLRIGMPTNLLVANNCSFAAYAISGGSGPKFCQGISHQGSNELHFLLEDGADWDIDTQTGVGFTGIIRLRDA